MSYYFQFSAELPVEGGEEGQARGQPLCGHVTYVSSVHLHTEALPALGMPESPSGFPVTAHGCRHTMSIAVYSQQPKGRRDPSGPSVDGWIHRRWQTHNGILFSLKKKEILTHDTIWMSLEDTTLREINPTQQDKYYLAHHLLEAAAESTHGEQKGGCQGPGQGK